MPPLPAHQTKHLQFLPYELYPSSKVITLEQDDSLVDSTGRTVWLGAQILSVYLSEILKGSKASKVLGRNRKRVLELGAGTGLLSLTLHNLGFDVLATDVSIIATGLLASNLARNQSTLLSSPLLESRTLDWFSLPPSWSFTSHSISPPHSIFSNSQFLQPPFDLIVTTDSIYHPSLSTPLLRTLHALSSPPLHLFPLPPPPIYISLEVRDAQLIYDFMSSAKDDWGFKCSQVEEGRLERVVRGLEWDKEDWEGVQVWKLVWERKSGKPSSV